MTLETPETMKLWTDLRGLEKEVMAALDETLGHLPSKRALFIAGDRVLEAFSYPTPDNIKKAREAMGQAREVFGLVNQFHNGNAAMTDIGTRLMSLEDAYVRDFPDSWIATRLRTGKPYLLPL